MSSLIIHAFSGDHAGPIANRASNEILFTAYWADSAEPADISPIGFTAVQLSPPAAPYYLVTLIRESPWICRAKLSVFEGVDVPSDGVYLFDLQLGTARGLGGFAIATARIISDIPRVPVPTTGEKLGELLARNTATQSGG